MREERWHIAQKVKRAKKKPSDFHLRAFKFGAGNEARTRDLNLGKVALYQLSYSRTKSNILTVLFKAVNSVKIIPISHSRIYGHAQVIGHGNEG